MSRLMKPEEQMTRGAEPPDRPSPATYQDQINRLVEAVNRNTKEMQDLRMLIHTIGKNQELESGSLQMKCNGIQAQVDNMMRMICNGGVPMQGFMINGSGNMGEYPMPEVSRVRHYSSSSINAINGNGNIGRYPVLINQQPGAFDRVELVEQSRMDIRNRDQRPSSSSHQPPTELDRSPSPEFQMDQVPKRPWERYPVNHAPLVSSSTEYESTSRNPKTSRISNFSASSSSDLMETEPESAEPACIFCKSNRHPSASCYLYQYNFERMRIAEKEKYCLKCLEKTEDIEFHPNCPKSNKKCKVCKGAHNLAFCERLKESQKNLLQCFLCRKDNHDSINCPHYFVGMTARQRRLKFMKGRRCLQCLKYNSNPLKGGTHLKCKYPDHVCQLCFPEHNSRENAAHHPMLCEYFYDGQHVEPPKKTNARRPTPY